MARPSVVLSDLDDRPTLDAYIQQIPRFDCRNLAVEFSTSTASAGLNLTVENISDLLRSREGGDATLPCLWINLWGWTQEHQAIIAKVAKHYDMSPRLAHTMCPRPYHIATDSDVSSSNSLGKDDSGSLRSMADVFRQVWHFGTVDVGRRYICMGWNALFFLPQLDGSAAKSKPNADRIWSTILLCDDGTVVSVFEDPPNAEPGLISRTRRNQLNVFRNLSRTNSSTQNALMQTSIRPIASAGTIPTQNCSDMAGLLFYYLFDDWENLFRQVSGSENSYRQRLESLREEMFRHPSPEQINSLHQLGKQLGALRSICKSYQSLMEQLVRCQAASSNFSQVQPSASTDQLGTSSEAPVESIRLPPSTGARFERLMYRIDLCALTELDECIAEKEGLVQMNFNLSNLREAQTVERLTRTTILLAKFTILFLPISLATSYFSMQLQDIQDIPLRTYWVTFAVVAIVTVSFLTGFEWLSSKYSGKPDYTGLLKTFFLDRRSRSKTSEAPVAMTDIRR